jgi:hypothetical protein
VKDNPPPLEDDRTAMMLGLVPDKRMPEERLLDAIETGGESLKYRYEPLGDSDGGTATGPKVGGGEEQP